MPYFKYIIVDTGAIIFNENTTHSQVAKGLGKVYSAGFVVFKFRSGTITEPICYGKSDSLEIGSKPRLDKTIIKDLFEEISQIKYYGFSVKKHYETPIIKP